MTAPVTWISAAAWIERERARELARLRAETDPSG